MNAQAALLNSAFEPTEYIKALIFTPEEETAIQDIRAGIDDYVKESIALFITGELDIHDDAVWQGYLREFDGLGLAQFVATAQAAYDRTGF